MKPGGRKFWLAVCVLAAATGLSLLNRLDGGDWATVVSITISMFGLGNGAEHMAGALATRKGG